LIRASIVKPLICPSDTHDGYTGDPNRAVTNYAGSLGAQHMGSNTGCNLCTVVPTPPMPTPGGVPPCESWFTTGDRERADYGDSDRISGVFGRGGGTGTNNPPWAARLANVTDGTANVIAMGEVRPFCGDHSRNGWMHANANWFATTAPINFNTCPGEGGLSVNDGSNPVCNRLQSWNTSMGFKSSHPGGAQFVFCDGSTHFLPATINYDTYQRLGDRRDANPVSGGF
jgi:prepilin-type processing-associated H-X9-DG protein